MIAQSVQDQRGSAPSDLSVIIRDFQRLANTSGPGDPPHRSIGRLRVMFAVGSSWPSRAIESDCSSAGKRMMCFRESDQIQRILLERLEPQWVDDEFVAEHLATPGGLPGITSDWVPSHLFDAMFESHGFGAGEQGYQITPDRTGILPRTRGPSGPGVVDVDR